LKKEGLKERLKKKDKDDKLSDEQIPRFAA